RTGPCIGDGPVRADALGADLVGLAAVMEPRLVGRNHGPGVAEPKRQRRAAQLPGHESRDRHGPLADERDDVAPRVGELVQAAPLVDAEAQVEHVHALDQGRDDVAVAPSPHLGQERFLRLAKDLRLGGKEVAKAGHPAQLRLRVGEETSGPRPAENQLSSPSSSASPSASSEKSIVSDSSSTACIPSSMSSPAGSSANVSPPSSSVNTSTSRASRLSFVYGRNSTSRLRRIGKLGLPAKCGSW